MMQISDILFAATILLSLSTYLFYPLVIALLGRLMPVTITRADTQPRVSIIIAAYNEALHIDEKIRNTLALDYPRDRLEILVGSDGSSDDTATIVDAWRADVTFRDFEVNRGKTAVQNDLAAMAEGDILVFTDAASFLPADALKHLVSGFADASVGCVAGCMQFLDTDRNLTTQSQGLYWRYELAMRKMESQLGSLIGVDGPLYAVRRENYVPLGHHIISDLMTPLLVLGQGRRVILEPNARVGEEPTGESSQEMRTRRRITLRGLVGIFSHGELLNPLRHPGVAAQIFFHKLLRWFVGPLVLVNFIVCLLNADRGFYQVMLALYGVFALLALAGWLFRRAGINAGPLFSVPYYFTLVNAAATAGIVDFFMGRQAVTWKPVRTG